MAAFSEKEVEFMKSILSNVEGGEAALAKLVDFSKVEGYATMKSTRVMFHQLFKKLNGTAASPKGQEKAAASTPQGVQKSKATSSKGGRKKKAVSDEFVSDAAGEGNVQKAGSETLEDPVETINKEINDDAEQLVKHETSAADETEVKDEQEE